MAYFFGGKQLEPGKPFSAGGTMFPGNYLDLSTLEEKKALGITEQEDPEPVRIAGDGPTPSTEENSLTNTTNTTPFPETDVDASTKEFLDSLGQDFFDQYLKPQYAGDRLNVQDGRLNYNKPENQKGGVIRYARPDKVAPLPTEFLPTTGGTPTTPTTPTLTPPPGTSPSIPSPSTPDFKAETPSSGGDDGGGDDGGGDDGKKDNPPLTEPPGKEPEETFKVPDPTPAPASAPTSAPTPVSLKAPELSSIQRYYDEAAAKHFYTNDPGKEGLAGYASEGEAFSLYKDQDLAKDAADVYRLFSPGLRNHFYTTSTEEKDAAVAAGYNFEEIIGEAYTAPKEGATEIKRFLSSRGKHFYTGDTTEINRLAGDPNFKLEGTAFYAPTKKSFLSTAYGNSPDIFGTVDYQAASQAGNTDDDIKAYLQINKTKLGEDIGQKFGLQTQNYNYTAPPAPRKQISAEYGNSTDIFGATDYDENIKLGYSDDEIKNYLVANKTKLGEETSARYNLPKQAYNYKPLVMPKSPIEGNIRGEDISTRFGNSDVIFGTKDYDYAKSKPFSDDEIKDFLEKNNVPLGDDIASKFRLAGQLYSLYND
jgi:hypothetical protein